MTAPPPPDTRTTLGLAHLFATIERLKEDERQARKVKEDTKLTALRAKKPLWWEDKA
jgi:hypothetical protein